MEWLSRRYTPRLKTVSPLLNNEKKTTNDAPTEDEKQGGVWRPAGSDGLCVFHWGAVALGGSESAWPVPNIKPNCKKNSH